MNINLFVLLITGMVYQKERLNAVGGFDERLGRIGGRLLSGEETQIQKRIEAQGGYLYYHPEISVRHFVPKERSRPGWFYRRYFWGGRTDYIISKTLPSKKSRGQERLLDHTQNPIINNNIDRYAKRRIGETGDRAVDIELYVVHLTIHLFVSFLFSIENKRPRPGLGRGLD